jgi:hypothetical protein
MILICYKVEVSLRRQKNQHNATYRTRLYLPPPIKGTFETLNRNTGINKLKCHTIKVDLILNREISSGHIMAVANMFL